MATGPIKSSLDWVSPPPRFLPRALYRAYLSPTTSRDVPPTANPHLPRLPRNSVGPLDDCYRHTTMATRLSPELQDMLEELERELEVRVVWHEEAGDRTLI